jgi:hypothetical protein
VEVRILSSAPSLDSLSVLDDFAIFANALLTSFSAGMQQPAQQCHSVALHFRHDVREVGKPN